MKIAVILVHYHTPDLLLTAIGSIRADLKTSELEAEIIVIDNGSLPEDQDLLNSLAVKLINPGENLGYARGVNLGVLNTDADIFFFMNPDVEILPNCIRSLVEVIEQGAAAAGPRFYLDKDQRILHPPLMDLTIRNEILWRTAALGDHWAKSARDSWRKEAKRYWASETPIESYCLTGALLAIGRKAWNQIGTFDEIYQLYFEEVDWLKRLEKSNLKSYYVPEAKAIHTYNQSASKEPQAKIWFQESNEIFRKRHYGTLFNFFLKKIIPFIRRASNFKNSNQTSNSFASTGLPLIDIGSFSKIRNSPIWIEISENDLGIPAAAMPILDTKMKVWRFPKELWDKLEPKIYHFRTVDNLGNEIFHFTYAHYQAI
ncbi:MAG: glycosyltransferase family 2 protein [Thermodesulfobacteriota bacterium]